MSTKYIAQKNTVRTIEMGWLKMMVAAMIEAVYHNSNSLSRRGSWGMAVNKELNSVINHPSVIYYFG
ncbi:hypothetical protein NBRC116494_02760 [Aurantivibrio plasticivorans]